jgi:hypothetical protein
MIYTRNTSEFEHLYRRLPELAGADAPAFLTALVRDPAFVATQILPFLASVAPGREPYIAAGFGMREASACVQVFVWPAGAMTPIHDHTSWGVYHCVAGLLLEERYSNPI